MKTAAHDDYLALRDWFMATIRARGIDHRNQPFSYEADTEYDHAYYRLQAEARTLWQQRHGYAPSDEMLSRAFFDAELERYRRDRDRRQPLRWLRRWLGGRFRAPSAPT